MRTQYFTASSIDGFIADEANSLDWLLQFGEAEGVGSYDRFIAGVGALAMGSTTYEWVLRHHVHADADHPRPWMYTQPGWVFTSRELPGVAGADVRFVRGDVRPVHAAMVEAARGKNVWIVGGGELAGQFHDAGLLDDVIIGVAPVALGGGAPLLPRRIARPPMRLVEVVQEGPFATLHYALR